MQTNNSNGFVKARRFIIAVDIETTAPMHIGAIEKGRYEAGKLLRYADKNIGVECSLTRTQSLASGERLPVIPSSTISGKLRRAAADLLYKSWIARDIKVSPKVCNMLSTGSGTTEVKAPSIDSRRAARQDAFMRLFGGSSFMEHAHSIISIGWPILHQTENLLMSERISTEITSASHNDLTEVMAIVRKDDVQDLAIEGIAELVGLDALAKSFEDRSQLQQKRKKSEDAGEVVESKKTNLRTLNAFEAVRTGTSFALRVEVSAANSGHLGLMLLAMQSVLRDGQFGGKGAKGLGYFNVIGSKLIEVDQEGRHKSVLLELFKDKKSGFALVDDLLSQQAKQEAMDYVESVDSEFFTAFAEGDVDYFAKVA